MKQLLKQCRGELVAGRLAEARWLLDELGNRPYGLFKAGPELASAESYGIPEALRGLFDDRIKWVNYWINHAREEAQ